VFLAAFSCKRTQRRRPWDKIVANFHLNDGADPGETVDHNPNERAVAQPEEIRLIGRLCIIGWFLANEGTREIRVILYAKDDSFCATALADELPIEGILAVEHEDLSSTLNWSSGLRKNHIKNTSVRHWVPIFLDDASSSFRQRLQQLGQERTDP